MLTQPLFNHHRKLKFCCCNFLYIRGRILINYSDISDSDISNCMILYVIHCNVIVCFFWGQTSPTKNCLNTPSSPPTSSFQAASFMAGMPFPGRKPRKRFSDTWSASQLSEYPACVERFIHVLDVENMASLPGKA